MDTETIKLCKELGLKGKELNEFIKEREAEAERVRIAKKESEARAATEAERVRIAQKESEERAAAEAEKVREFELKKIELQLRSGIPNHTTTLNNQNNRRVENFELAPFIDGEDDIFRYVEDFEYYAQINKWNPNNWGIYLATFLTGNALGIYARMPSNEANDYFKLKCALLPKFRNAEDKCRLMKEERNVYDKENFEIEFVKSKHEIVVSPSALGSESFQQIISSQEFPMKVENSLSEIFAENEEPSSQDLPILPTFPKWERNEDEASSLSEALVEQDEREESSVTSNVFKRSDNAFSSKWLNNQPMTSCKSYMERNKEREVEYDRTLTFELEKVNTQETEKRDSSVHITTSYENESQIGQPRMGVSEFKFENEVKCNMFDTKFIIEVKEEHEHDLTVITNRDHFSRNEKKTIKRSFLECKKNSQSHSSQDKYNSKDIDKGPVANQADREYDMHVVKRRDRPLRNEEKIVRKLWSDCEKVSQSLSSQNERNSKDLDKKQMKIQKNNSSNHQRMENKEKFDIHVSPKFGEDYIDVFTKEVVKIQVGEGKLFNSQSEENKQMIDQSHTVIPSKKINDFKISHELEPEEEDSVEGSNIVAISELTFKSEDMKVESDSHLPFSSSSLFSPYSSSSFSNNVEENETKGMKKRKMNQSKRKKRRKGRRHIKKKQDDADYNYDEKSEKPIVIIYVENAVNELNYEENTLVKRRRNLEEKGIVTQAMCKLFGNTNINKGTLTKDLQDEFNEELQIIIEFNLYSKWKDFGFEEIVRILNCKCDRKMKSASFMIWIEQLKLFKYRRKGKNGPRKHRNIGVKTESKSRIWRRTRLIINCLHAPGEEWSIVFSYVSLKYGCHQEENNSFIEDKRYENVLVFSRKYKRKLYRLLESSAFKTKRLENFKKCSDLIVLEFILKTPKKELGEYFESLDDILRAQMEKDSQTGQSKGFDFICYASCEVKQEFLGQRHMIDGRICDVKMPNSLERAERMMAADDTTIVKKSMVQLIYDMRY